MTPCLDRLKAGTPLLWTNAGQKPAAETLAKAPLGELETRDAQARLYRFAPLIMELFPEETGAAGGLIESELVRAPRLAERLEKAAGSAIGQVLIKRDDNLPVAGSIKARGGLYEVLCFAEQLAMEQGMLSPSDNYAAALRAPSVRALFRRYAIAVGSTGNLGLSVGVMATALGFQARVYMSSDAKEWKKARLRHRGVEVVECPTDYAEAVDTGRRAAERDPLTYFVDDEGSVRLFLGYAAAAYRFSRQLSALGVTVDKARPLFVHLPCGIGGAPGGVTFGLKRIYGDAVHCFFAEPVRSPCFALGMMTGKHAGVSVYDVGLDNRTDLDGLAVSRPSRLVGDLVAPLISGGFTLTDAQAKNFLRDAWETESVPLEPSAAAGFAGPVLLASTDKGRDYAQRIGLETWRNATHVLWTTGGRYVPETEFRKFLSGQ